MAVVFDCRSSCMLSQIRSSRGSMPLRIPSRSLRRSGQDDSHWAIVILEFGDHVRNRVHLAPECSRAPAPSSLGPFPHQPKLVVDVEAKRPHPVAVYRSQGLQVGHVAQQPPHVDPRLLFLHGG
jgi:acetyl esterase/lipase